MSVQNVRFAEETTTLVITEESQNSLGQKVSQCCCDCLDNCSFRKVVNRTALCIAVLSAAATVGLIIGGAIKGQDDAQGSAMIKSAFATMILAGCCFVPGYLGTKKHSGGSSFSRSDYDHIGGGAAAF